MRKVLSLFLSLCLALTPCIGLACNHWAESSSADQVPSITVEDLYDVSGDATLFCNSKFDHMAMVRAFSEDIVDCIPLILHPQEDRHIFFILNHPVPAMEYDCFIIDADGNLIGNAECKYLECICGEWWYDVNLTIAPGKYQENQIVYLIWVE